MMKLLISFLILCYVSQASSKDLELKNFYRPHWDLTDQSIEYLHNGEILSDAIVHSKNDHSQEFTMHVAALHPKSCSKILKKLSMLDNYAQWISFIKTSSYDDKNRLFTIRADHLLLPYPMLVHVIMDRPKKEGTYPFVFPTGIFTGLSGQFIIKKHKNKCAFYATSTWKGKHTKLPSFVIELFSETLTKIGGEILFRKIN